MNRAIFSHSRLISAISRFAVLALGAFFIAAAATTSTYAQDRSQSLIGHPAPAFALQDFQHKTIRLSQFRGKVVLLNFWASWCAPCQAEMPTFAQWQNQYRGRLQVIGVNMDDQIPKAEAAARKLKVNYPLVVGTAHMAEAFGGIYGLPVTFLIDTHGHIRDEYQGGNHLTQIHAEIERLLSHPAR